MGATTPIRGCSGSASQRATSVLTQIARRPAASTARLEQVRTLLSARPDPCCRRRVHDRVDGPHPSQSGSPGRSFVAVECAVPQLLAIDKLRAQVRMDWGYNANSRLLGLGEPGEEEKAMTIAELRLNRREALMGTGLVGAGALAALVSGCGGGSTAAANSPSSGLEGAWLEEISLDDGQRHQALILCTKDGGVGVTASLPPTLFGSGFGVWTRTGDHQYLITFEAFVFNASGQLDFLLRVRASPTIDQTGDHMTARVHFDVQPAGGSSLTGGGGGNWTGSRIKPLPL